MYSPVDDSRPQHGRRQRDQEAEKESMVGFTDARVEPRTMMIKTMNTSTTVLAVVCSQRLLYTHRPSHC